MCDEPYYTCRRCGTHFYGWSASDSCSVCGGDLVHDDLFAEEDLKLEEPVPGGGGRWTQLRLPFVENHVRRGK